MKLVILSDTHSKHRQIEVPDGDTLIFAGDMCNWGVSDEVKDFNKWLGTLPHKNKVVVSGNHDICLDSISKRKSNESVYDGHKLITNALYLENEAVEIEGIKFWGSPITPTFFDWAFMEDRDKIHKYWDLIPIDTNVVITHGPMYGIHDYVTNNLNPDRHVGCKALLRRIQEFYPTVFICGHIHDGHGVKTISNGIKQTHCINASVLNEQYKVAYKPITIEI